jgi:hypothetical protein
VFPHCLLVIEKAHLLFEMGALGTDYLDYLILRLNRDNQGIWYRNHFPVILETNKSQFFHEGIYNKIQQSEITLPTLEF